MLRRANAGWVGSGEGNGHTCAQARHPRPPLALSGLAPLLGRHTRQRGTNQGRRTEGGPAAGDPRHEYTIGHPAASAKGGATAATTTLGGGLAHPPAAPTYATTRPLAPRIDHPASWPRHGPRPHPSPCAPPGGRPGGGRPGPPRTLAPMVAVRFQGHPNTTAVRPRRGALRGESNPPRPPCVPRTDRAAVGRPAWSPRPPA